MTSAKPTFEPLIKLFRADPDKVQRALSVFERITRNDLEQLDQAYASHDWATIEALAHKMKSGCMQLGEVAAAAGLATIERSISTASTNDAFARQFSVVRDELNRVMMRVAGYLAEKGEGG